MDTSASVISPDIVLRNFSLKSSGQSDNAIHDWIASESDIFSTPKSPLLGATSFCIAPGGGLTTKPISLNGAGAIRAAQVKVRFEYLMDRVPSSPLMANVNCALQFDGGVPVLQTKSIVATGSWSEASFAFDVPPLVQTCTVTLYYPQALSDPPSFLFDNFEVIVLSNEDSATFLSRKYDEVCWICAHNAYADDEEGWLVAQQSFPVTTQLQHGVRALMLDIMAVNQDIFLIHEGWWTSTVLRPGFSDFRRLQATLYEVNEFLDQNPDEIVTIFFQSYVKQPADYHLTVDAFRNAGHGASNLLQKVFRYDQPNTDSKGRTWDVAAQGAPTLQWMVEANKRCVVFSDWRGNDQYSTLPTAPDGWAKTWYFVRENCYGDKSLRPPTSTAQRDESRDAESNTRKRTLNLLNHFPDFVVGMIRQADMNYEFINDAEGLEAHVDKWLLAYPRLPNFLAVDFVEVGANGGPLNAVKEINRRWVNQSNRTDPPLAPGKLVPNGKSPDTVKQSLRNSGATDSRVAVVVNNMSDNDFTLLRSYARHGAIVNDLPKDLPGRIANPVRLVNGGGSTGCTGVCTTTMGMIGPQCFWLLSTPGTTKVLFIAVSSPYNKLFYNNYANARWIDPANAVSEFIAKGTGGDALFDNFFVESNNQTSDCADVRVRARPWICGTSAMSNATPGDMTVSLWTY